MSDNRNEMRRIRSENVKMRNDITRTQSTMRRTVDQSNNEEKRLAELRA